MFTEEQIEQDAADRLNGVSSAVRGISANVYRCASGTDCTNGGVSSRVGRVVLIGDDLPKLVEPSEIMPALYLDTAPVIGRPYEKALPNPIGSPDNHMYMFGGNFVYTCDSRGPSNPVPIHDRKE